MDMIIHIAVILAFEIVGFTALGLFVMGLCWISIKLTN